MNAPVLSSLSRVLFAVIALLMFHLAVLPAFGQDAPAAPAAPETPAEVGTAAPEAPAPLPAATGDIMWLVITAAMVFFMQAGFAMVEGGLTRAKNSCNIMMKNLLDFCFGSLAFWAIGYAIMFGTKGNAIFGWDNDLVMLGSYTGGQDNKTSAMWFFQVVFAATAATIVSGAMAERTKIGAYILYSIFISLVIYPVSGHWIWGGGWLGSMGMRDFAGSTVVHSVGAWAGLAGSAMLGPRFGKFGANGEVKVIPGHNLPMATLGCFILWFGWYGFNPGSTLLAIPQIAHVAVTTTLAAAAGACASTVTTWMKFGKPDLSMALNGTLAGLVAITAPCASVSTGSAVIIGIVAGVLVVYSCLFFERVVKIDDPVGAISVHGICGAWGTLSVGLFGERAIDLPYWNEELAIKDGLFHGGGFSQLAIQAVGVASVFAWVFVTMVLFFMAVKYTVGMRVSVEEEKEGLDLGEHGMEAYPDFVQYGEK